jgi:hypothetical protein
MDGKTVYQLTVVFVCVTCSVSTLLLSECCTIEASFHPCGTLVPSSPKLIEMIFRLAVTGPLNRIKI